MKLFRRLPLVIKDTQEDNMMIATKYALLASVSLSFLCLIVGFGIVGYWEISLIIPAILASWYFARKVSRQVVLSILLVIYVFLAALGLLIKLSPNLMLIGCSSALFSWESALFFQRMNNGNGSFHQGGQRLETLHLKDLSIAMCGGVAIGLLGINIRLHLQFGLIVGMAIIVMLGFFRGIRYLME